MSALVVLDATPVGTITLCQVCHRAIRVVLDTWRDPEDQPNVLRSQRMWVHMARPGVPHDVEPAPSVLDVGVCPGCARTTHNGRCSCGYGVQ